MKILILSNVFPPKVIGGAEVSAYNLCRALMKDGHDIHVLTMADSNEQEVWNELTPEGFHIFRLHFPCGFSEYEANKGDRTPSWWRWKLWYLQNFFDPRNSGVIRRVVEAVQPDHINIHNLSGFGFNALRSLPRQASVTWILHDLNLACTRSGMFLNGRPCAGQCRKCGIISRLKAHFIRQLQRLVFISPSRVNLETVQRYNDAVRARPGFAIANIPDPMPANLPQHTAELNGICRILFVGKLHVTKGISVLLEALAPLAETFRFHLTILGRGPEEEELKQRYGNMPWVTFGGFVAQDDVTRAVAAHDLLCTPSIWAEPYGRVTAQALQLGTPVLGSNIGGTTELIRHEETGLLIEPGNVQAWREACARVFSTPSLLAAWRANTRKYAHEFDESTILKQFEEAVHYARHLQ